MQKLPKARTENIVVQTAGDETMIYDLDADRAYLLNETSAFVWQMCDGQNDLAWIAEALAEKTQQAASEDFVKLAIDGLRANNLLDDAENVRDYFTKTSRRKAIRQIGLATMIALPMIYSLTAPTAAHAASNRGNVQACQSCTAPAQCATGNCAPAGPNFNPNAQICSRGSDTSGANRPGTNMNAAGSAQQCASFATQYCCSGSSTFISSGNCPCN